MRKVLIIKLGYSETLDRILSLTTSLGEVLRTTFILHYFKEDCVWWLVDEKALPLLRDNKYIERVLVYSPGAIEELEGEDFDIVINFEKLPEICAFSDSLKAKKRFGFRFNTSSNNAQNYLGGSKRLIEISQNINKRKENKDSWQKILAEAIEKDWRGEGYILGYDPCSRVKSDIGFNWTTSNKWKNKAWPKRYWEELETLIKNKYSVSWQQGMDNLYEYIDWVNSCRLIVTADTLGLHLALALRKRVIALFGPTPYSEVYLYNCGTFLLPKAPYNCIPCCLPVCNKKKQCMEYIYPYMVKKAIDNEFKKDTYSR